MQAASAQGVRAAVSSVLVQMQIALVREPQYSGTSVKQANYSSYQHFCHEVNQNKNEVLTEQSGADAVVVRSKFKVRP